MAEVLRVRRAPVAQPLWRVRLRLAGRGVAGSWRMFCENPIGLIGLGVILLFGLLALAHPILMATVWDQRTYDPIIGFDATILTHPSPPSPPTARHLLGTDPIGRDVLSQLMYSAR